MSSTGLEGPFNLTHESIDSLVKEISSGAYVLGYTSRSNAFIVKYVGRSDDNLNSRLHDWVGIYNQFKASYLSSSTAAFEKECNVYHDFGRSEKLDNEIHPDCPNGSSWKCPRCYIFD